MAKKESGFVVGHSPSVGKGDFANMPQDVKMQSYPKSPYYMDSDLNDSMTGIDEVNYKAEVRSRKFLSNQK